MTTPEQETHQQSLVSDASHMVIVTTCRIVRTPDRMTIILFKPDGWEIPLLFQKGDPIVIEGNGKQFRGTVLQDAHASKWSSVFISVEGRDDIDTGMIIRKQEEQ